MHNESPQARVVALSGQLDVYRAEHLREVLRPASLAPRLVIDLSGVPWISAAALSEFVRLHKYRSKLGLESIRFVVDSAAVRAVFEITGLTGLWRMYDDAQAAAARSDGTVVI